MTFGKWLTYTLICLFFTLVLATVAWGETWIPDRVRLWWLIRFPLLGGVGLVAISFSRCGPVRPLIGGLVVLNRKQLAMASAGATLTLLAISLTARTALREAVGASAESCQSVAAARFPELNAAEAKRVAAWFGPLAVRPSLAWFQLLLVVPVLAVMARNPANPRDSQLVRAGLVVLSVAGTLGAAMLAAAWAGAWMRRLGGLFDWPASLVGRLGPGYFIESGGSFRLRDGHVETASLLAMYLVAYAAGYFLLHPGGRHWLVRWWRDALAPPVHYVLLLLTIAVFGLTGLSFLLDHWRISTLLFAAVVSYSLYRWLLFDHYFQTGETRAPGAEAAAARNGIRPALNVARPDFIFADNLAEAQGTPRAAGGRAAAVAPAKDRTVVVVTAYGGGILAGAWVVRVLSGLMGGLPGFQERTRLISGVSGGSVGALFLFDELLRNPAAALDVPSVSRVNETVRKSSLEATAWGLAYPGLLRLLLPAIVWDRCYDNGWALEQRWMGDLGAPNRTLAEAARLAASQSVPHLLLNAVCTENGRRFLFSTDRVQFRLDKPGRSAFGFFGQYPQRDLRLVTAARLSASFPFVSPISRIDHEPEKPAFHFADGGYFDNFGVFSASEWIRMHLARRANDEPNELENVGRIVVVRICSRQASGVPKSLRVGWRNALFGPLETLVNVRAASQAERVSSELELLRDWCWSQHAVDLQEFTFELTHSGPLSWQLGPRDPRKIEQAWRPWQWAIDGRPGSTKKHQAAANTIEALKQYL